jgi:SAM-dependent methyltransferase
MKISKIYIFLIGITLSFALIIPISAQNRFDVGDDKYTPSMGQSGKDVIWIPTGNDLVSSMLKIAEVTPKDLVYDLGAGDGKIAIAAAKEFGANAIGIEFNPDMAALAQRNANRAGVGNKVKIINGDIFILICVNLFLFTFIVVDFLFQ